MWGAESPTKKENEVFDILPVDKLSGRHFVSQPNKSRDFFWPITVAVCQSEWRSNSLSERVYTILSQKNPRYNIAVTSTLLLLPTFQSTNTLVLNTEISFLILVKSTEIKLHILFSNLFSTEFNSVWFKNNQNMVDII